MFVNYPSAVEVSRGVHLATDKILTPISSHSPHTTSEPLPASEPTFKMCRSTLSLPNFGYVPLVVLTPLLERVVDFDVLFLIWACLCSYIALSRQLSLTGCLIIWFLFESLLKNAVINYIFDEPWLQCALACASNWHLGRLLFSNLQEVSTRSAYTRAVEQMFRGVDILIGMTITIQVNIRIYPQIIHDCLRSLIVVSYALLSISDILSYIAAYKTPNHAKVGTDEESELENFGEQHKRFPVRGRVQDMKEDRENFEFWLEEMKKLEGRKRQV
jgi:hypothetical protein